VGAESRFQLPSGGPTTGTNLHHPREFDGFAARAPMAIVSSGKAHQSEPEAGNPSDHDWEEVEQSEAFYLSQMWASMEGVRSEWREDNPQVSTKQTVEAWAFSHRWVPPLRGSLVVLYSDSPPIHHDKEVTVVHSTSRLAGDEASVARSPGHQLGRGDGAGGRHGALPGQTVQ
jgi:hypothetical protein